MNKWLAAIGAGREQVASIRAAKDLGYNVVAFDSKEDAPGFSIADVGVQADFAKINSIIEVCQAKNILAVIPAPLGASLRIVGEINDALNLPGINGSAARACTDKAIFHEKVFAAGARRPAQVRADKFSEALTQLQGQTGLFVAKPISGSGSRGVIMFELPMNLPFLPTESVSELDSGDAVLIEECVIGDEVGVDGYVLDGRLVVLLMRDKELTQPPFRQETAYCAPSVYSVDTIQRQLQICATAIGLDRCVFHADVMLTEQGPVVIEMAGRPGGLLLSETVIPVALGINYLECALRLVIDGFPIPAPAVVKPTALQFYTTEAGLVRTVPLVSDLLNIPGVEFAQIAAQPSSFLKPLRSGADVLERGYVVTTGNSAASAVQLAKLVTKHFPICMEEI